jgi:hypothetical protein
MPFQKGNTYGQGAPKKYALDLLWNKRYSMAKAQAKFRKEEWAFTDVTWYGMWEKSGVKEHFGRQSHQYCMVRKDPIEAWGPHNCVIIPRRMHLKKRAYVEFHNYPDIPWEDRHNVEIKNES